MKDYGKFFNIQSFLAKELNLMLLAKSLSHHEIQLNLTLHFNLSFDCSAEDRY